MLKKIVGLWGFSILLFQTAFGQVDTTYLYRTGMPYGTLDIRIAKSSTRYYYLEEGKTFSFRESSPGVKTNSYRDMTTWDSAPYTQGNLREKNGNSNAFIMNYRLLFPLGYNPSIADGYPLIVMIHGLGERGNCWDNNCHWGDRSWKPSSNTPAAPTTTSHELLNNDHNLLHGGNIHLQMRNSAGTKLPNDPTLPDRSFPGFVLFPQNLNGWDANQAQDVIRMIRLAVKKYKIDPNRIYIHGLSNGGAAVYDIVKRAPWLFSAAAPMSAVSDGGITTSGMTSKVATVPFWIFQGGQDGNPTPSKTNGYIKKFKEAGWSVRYSLYEQIGHGTWNTAFNEPDFFSWLRSKNKADIHVFADNPTLCQTTGQGVKLEVSEGFLAYQWERNGSIIPGATSAAYTATQAGTYRARFSRISTSPGESQWNPWSDPVTVTTSNPAQAQAAQLGTVVLKDLNNYAYAHLYSVQPADHYYWYKDGVLVNLSGSVDDTVRYARFSAGDCSTGNCAGNGAYTLVTASYNNCPSPPSIAKNIFFNNQAPINITAPPTFTSTSTTEAKTTLQWTDGSSNEGGFEIWRRKKTGTTTYTKWTMSALTAANVTTYTDLGLEPSSTYQYKIRGVSSTGRSNYTPLSSSQYLTVVTAADVVNPTTPLSLTATATGIKEVTLTWEGSIDNTGIREYVITYGSTSVATGSNKVTHKLTGLALNENFTFTVKAKDLGGNLSAASNTATANTYVSGLYYKHTTGAFSDIDLIDWNFVEFTGKVETFSLTPRTQDDYFNFQYEGYLYIDTPGTYEFQTTSDDGSRLKLDTTILVDNDGKHGTRTITSAPTTLASGPHEINVKYFEDTGGQNLTVKYKGPDSGNAWVTIPTSALRSGNQSTSIASTTSSVESMVASIFPNPMTETEEMSVQVTTEDNLQPVHVTLINLTGQPFFEKTYSSGELNEGQQVVPTQKLQKGMYIMVIKQGDKTVRERVIIRD
jgi:hypothetical protein